MYKFIHIFLKLNIIISILVLSACGGESTVSPTEPVIIPPSTTIPVSQISDFDQNTHDATFTSNHFAGSSNCAICHDNIKDNQGNELSIVKDWSASMMANAAKDPLWKAKVQSELNRYPDLTDVITDKCTRCHMPMASIEAKDTNQKVSLFNDGFLNPANPLHDEAMDGVSCTLCHQIENTEKFGTDDGFSGHFTIGDKREIYGQYTDVLTQPMINNVNFLPIYSKHISSSELCASCHDLKTPFVDMSGTIVDNKTFPEQMPYSEWQESSFSDEGSTPSTCQQCHMPQVINAGVKIANRPNNGVTSRDQFSQHLFLGANTYLMSILKDNASELNTEGVKFDSLIARNREFLKTAGALNVRSANIIDEKLIIDIQVTNVIGHKLPTAYPSRRVYIHLTVKNDENLIIFESGKTQDNGAIVGNDADFDRTTYEPHYQIITKPDQVQLYETIMGNVDNEVTYTLLQSAQYLKDNRLLPLGFDKATAPEDVAVFGLAKSDKDFIQGQDLFGYHIDVSQFNSTKFTVELSLDYQPVAFSFLQDLFTDTSAAVSRFKAYNQNRSVKYETISEKSIVINR